jgi:hypothetical protein
MIGESHGLQRLVQTLEDLRQGQTQLAIRDNQTQDQLARLTQLTQRTGWAMVAVLALVLLLGGAIGWQAGHPPDTGYARVAGALDTTLTQQWQSLPKGTQEALANVYSRLGLVPPGSRK